MVTNDVTCSHIRDRLTSEICLRFDFDTNIACDHLKQGFLPNTFVIFHTYADVISGVIFFLNAQHSRITSSVACNMTFRTFNKVQVKRLILLN